MHYRTNSCGLNKCYIFIFNVYISKECVQCKKQIENFVNICQCDRSTFVVFFLILGAALRFVNYECSFK